MLQKVLNRLQPHTSNEDVTPSVNHRESSGDFASHGWIIARTVRFLVFFVVAASVDLPQKPLKHAKTSTFQARDQQNMKCLLLSLGGMIHLDRQVWPATKD